MQLSEASIQEYMRLYEEKFGTPISPEEARDMATSLVALYEILCRSAP